MTSLQINESFNLDGKEYKIVGTAKRSLILECNGKKYKTTHAKIQKALANEKELDDPQYYLKKRLEFDKIFNQNAKLPETLDELLEALDRIEGDLSPENLTCDGELSSTKVRQKRNFLMEERKEIVKLIASLF